MKSPFRYLLLLLLISGGAAAQQARTTVDKPDDSPKPQIRAMYVLPSDFQDEALDTNGRIVNSMGSFNTWFRAQAGGREFRFDRYQGFPDIGYVRLNKTNAYMVGTDPTNINVFTGHKYVLKRIFFELEAMGQIVPNKLYAVYYGGGSLAACGGAGYPPTNPIPGGAVFLKGTIPNATPCYFYTPGNSTNIPGYFDYSMFHEIAHSMGAVAAAAPNHYDTNPGHVVEPVANPDYDFMYGGALGNATANVTRVLDYNRNDYYAHSGSWVDIQDSPFIVPTGGDPVPIPATPPVVFLTAPANGATVLGSVTLTANAVDNVAVLGVQFKVDGVNLGTEDTTSPYSKVWGTTSGANGAHVLTAVARSSDGSTTSVPRTVTVNNPPAQVTPAPPTVSLTAPANGATVLGSIAVSATANDDIAVLGVQFKVDGVNLGVEDTSSPYSVTWNTVSASEGTHTITAVARDAVPFSTISAARTVTVDNQPAGLPPSFPGAQGGGAKAVGGRGGVVIEVTNLSNNGTGSLRACVDAVGPRTCVFRVGGTINLNSGLEMRAAFLTIAGQTAPGGGIQLRGTNIAQEVILLNAPDVIIRYLRVRKGFKTGCEVGSSSDCGANVFFGANGLIGIIDHVSSNWNQDESVFLYKKDVTLSYSLLAEGLITHPTSVSGGGSTAAISETMTGIDVHHNLLMSNSHRSPSWRAKSVRVVNNIIYNVRWWSARTTGGMSIDYIGNRFQRGPQPLLNASFHEMAANDIDAKGAAGLPSLYLLGNVGWNQSNPAGDQWVMTANLAGTDNAPEAGVLPEAWKRTTPMTPLTYPITADPVGNLNAVILPTVGASRRLDCNGNWVMNRDSQDTRLVNEYLTGGGRVTHPTTEADSGGYPVLAAGTPCPDADHDGMPDAWESSNGLNPNNAADRNGVQPSGFTNLEVYLAGAQDPLLPSSPSVSISSPTNGATVGGASVTVSANAFDDIGVLGVQFKVDGSDLGAEDTTEPYSVAWDTTDESEGVHTLTAVARDAIPSVTTSGPVTVTVNNSGGSGNKFELGDRVRVNNGAITVRTLPTQGGGAGTSMGTQPLGTLGTVLSGPITTGAGGVYWEINYDSGLDGWSVETFLDDAGGGGNTAPNVSITEPAAGSLVSGLVAVSAVASDPGGQVLGVQFTLDGQNLGTEDTEEPFSVTWNSTLGSAGLHQLGARARDLQGATGTSALTVTVNNVDVCP